MKNRTPELDPAEWRRLREETGRGVEYLAPRIGPDGVAASTLSRWERGLLRPSGANRAAWWSALCAVRRVWRRARKTPA